MNPYYTPGPGENLGNVSHFIDAIRQSYAALNARRDAQYESELVPLSNRPGAPLIPQYKLPLDTATRP